jgi:ABC-2 type transport system ATP-binding protein/lipopolysaccharide transport system ATP-binding protein
VFVPGESVTLSLFVHAAAPVTDVVFGVGLFSAEGTRVYGTNTDLEGFTGPRVEGDGEVRLALEALSLVEGTYLVDIAAHRSDGTPYDYLRGQHSFRVKSRVKDVGLYRPLHRWSFAGGVSLDPPAPRAELDLGDEPGA